MGDGWTGSLGTGSLDSFVEGHDDAETLTSEPFQIFTSDKKQVVHDIATGWAHTVFVTKSSEPGGATNLWVTGRAFEFASLLRLQRLPKLLRMYAVQEVDRYNTDVSINDDKSVTPSPTFMANVISWMVGGVKHEQWIDARRYANLTKPKLLHLPKSLGPTATIKSIAASAGVTAIVTNEGKLLTFGLNERGQCGVGEESNNVWIPQVVPIDSPIQQVALGLQHGIALTTDGHIYVWGKAERGQLGLRDIERSNVPEPRRLEYFRVPHDVEEGGGLRTLTSQVTQVAAGLNFSALRTQDNRVYIFGKNVLPGEKDKKVQDGFVPSAIKGLPPDKKVIGLACGSHHTAMLLEDGSVYAVGLSTDGAVPILEPVRIVEPGIIELPVRQFTAHFDRTTIVGNGGTQVLQVHLWNEPELRERAVFTPPWLDHLSGKVRFVDRGWLHTAVVTDDYM